MPTMTPSRRRYSDVNPGEPANVGHVDVAAVAGDVAAGQVLDARKALAGVLQDGHQRECIGIAHYRAKRAPDAAAVANRVGLTYNFFRFPSPRQQVTSGFGDFAYCQSSVHKCGTLCAARS